MNVDNSEVRSPGAPWGRVQWVALVLLVGGTVTQAVRFAQSSVHSSGDLLLGLAAGATLAVAAGLLLPRVTGRGPAIAALSAAPIMLLLPATGPKSLPDGNMLYLSVVDRITDAASAN